MRSACQAAAGSGTRDARQAGTQCSRLRHRCARIMYARLFVPCLFASLRRYMRESDNDARYEMRSIRAPLMPLAIDAGALYERFA